MSEDYEPDTNEIVFCDACDVAVHQECYQIDIIPDDNWYCRSCWEEKEYRRKGQENQDSALDSTTSDVQTEVGTKSPKRTMQNEHSMHRSPSRSAVQIISPRRVLAQSPTKEADYLNGPLEFFVKWVDCSFRHCQWLKRSELELIASRKLDFYLVTSVVEEKMPPYPHFLIYAL